MSNFIPSSDDKKVIWANNYKTKLAFKATTLGLSPDVVAEQVALCEGIITTVEGATTAKSTYDSALSLKNETVNSNVTSIRNFVKNLKTSKVYNDAIGKELGLIAPKETLDKENFKSKLRIETHPGYLLIKFTKRKAEGINLYCRKQGELNWQRIHFFTHSPCIDNRPVEIVGQAENREYMCIGVVKDKEIGLQSDIVSVAFAG